LGAAGADAGAEMSSRMVKVARDQEWWTRECPKGSDGASGENKGTLGLLCGQADTKVEAERHSDAHTSVMPAAGCG